MTNLCVFSSGSGTNFIELYKFSIKNRSKLNLNLLISNKLSCGAVEFAKKKQINFKIINSSIYPIHKDYINRILVSLKNKNIKLIALAGYLKKIPEEVIEKYSRKILNIHPSLLPKYGGKGYYGMNVHEAVIKSGERKTGVTIHFIDKDYDKGHIIFQEEIPVLNNDKIEDLALRVLKVEHRVYKKVIKLIINNQITWINNKPKIIEIK